MIAMRIVKIADGAYFVPSYSEQTITTNYEVWGTVHAVGAADERQDEQTDDRSVGPGDELPRPLALNTPGR